VKKLIFLLLVFPFLSKSQAYKAGQVLLGYTDINPDTLIATQYSAPSTYSIDLNGDHVSDLRFVSQTIVGAGTQIYNIYVEPLNPSSFVVLERVDSAYNSYTSNWWVTNVAKPLAFGDTINKANTKWCNSVSVISDKSNVPGASKNILDWVNSVDQYVGVKYQDSGDTLVGWIRVYVPIWQKCYVKDFSFQSISIGIKEYNYSYQLKSYPNPTDQYLNFELQDQTKISEIEITNTIGQSVLRQPFKKQINISLLSTGCYFIKLISEDGTILHSKFVKE
jgi:hypothetical protein